MATTKQASAQLVAESINRWNFGLPLFIGARCFIFGGFTAPECFAMSLPSAFYEKDPRLRM